MSAAARSLTLATVSSSSAHNWLLGVAGWRNYATATKQSLPSLLSASSRPFNGGSNGSFVSMLGLIGAAEAKQRALTSAQERVARVGFEIQMIGSFLSAGTTWLGDKTLAPDAVNRKLADALHQRDRAWRDVNLPDGTDAAADIDDAVRCLRQEVVRLLQQADCVIEQGQLEEKAHEQVDEARELHRQFSECHGRGVCRATTPSTWRLRIGTDIATVTLVIALTVVDEVDVATGCFVLLLALLAFFVIAIWHRAMMRILGERTLSFR